MYAFVEFFDGVHWRLSEPLEFDEDYNNLVPKNVAPCWGKENSRWYCEISGFRGFPEKMDLKLVEYIKKYWTDKKFGDEAICTSWMTYDEALKKYENDKEGIYNHFSSLQFGINELNPKREYRITFWVDQ